MAPDTPRPQCPICAVGLGNHLGTAAGSRAFSRSGSCVQVGSAPDSALAPGSLQFTHLSPEGGPHLQVGSPVGWLLVPGPRLQSFQATAAQLAAASVFRGRRHASARSLAPPRAAPHPPTLPA